jgi:hypothetical protein
MMAQRGDTGKVVVLDNSVLSDVFARHAGTDMDARIPGAVVEHRIVIWTSPYLITETIAGSTEDPRSARRKLEFLLEVSEGHLLKNPRELLNWEGIHGGSPTGTDLFSAHNEEMEVYRWALDVADANGVVVDPGDGSEHLFRDLVYQDKSKEQLAAVQATKAARDAVIRAFEASKGDSSTDQNEAQSLAADIGGVNFPALGTWMRSMSRDDFAGWVSSALEQIGYHRTVSAQDLSLLPHTVSATGYLLSEIAGNYVTGKKWHRNDTYDTQYCVAASCADILITSDRGLQALCSQMPYRPFEVGGVEALERLLVP